MHVKLLFRIDFISEKRFITIYAPTSSRGNWEIAVLDAPTDLRGRREMAALDSLTVRAAAERWQHSTRQRVCAAAER